MDQDGTYRHFSGPVYLA